MRQKTLLKIAGLVFFVSVTAYLLIREDESSSTEKVVYEGPVSDMDSVRIIYSDSAKVKMIITGKKQRELQNGNQEFPEGVFVLFYDEEEQPTSRLTGDYGIIDKKTEIYTVIGNVEVINEKEKQQLNTEELNWNPRAESKERLYTDKFVRIETADEILTGEGMTSDQDFNEYEIKNVTGIFSLD